MNILFICGSLEPGSDGVGDYTRRLAVELIKEGHQINVVAINDHKIREVCCESQFEGSISLKTLRLPSSLKKKDRFKYVKEWIKEINPEFLSLQYVPFSFHPKGISFTISRYLKNVGKGKYWHIMFHELWVGMDQNSSLKLLIWGKVQKLLIKILIMNIRPVAMHTQTKIYQMQLQNAGISVKYLPLFSNIQVVDCSNLDDHRPQSNSNKKIIFLLLFGGIHPGAPVKQFAEEAADYAEKKSIQIILKIIGRSGVEQEHWATEWKSAGLPVDILGEQPADTISLMLGKADIGISTTPIALAEKSGTIAAMREHGLPVICVRDFWRAKGMDAILAPSGIFEYKSGNFQECLEKAKKNVGGTSVSEVAKIFTSNLLKVKAF